MTRASRTPSSRSASPGALAFVVLAGLTLAAVRTESASATAPAAREYSQESHAPPGETWIEVSSPVWSVALDGDRLHVLRTSWFAAGWYAWQASMLSIYDLSSSTPETPLGSAPFWDLSVRPGAFAVRDGFAYLGIGTSPPFGVNDYELRVLDVSDPAAPHVAATLALPERPSCVAASGGHAYVGDRVGLRVVDVADPGSPAVLGSIALSAEVVSVALRGPFAMVGTLDSRLAVVDISDPLLPVVISTLLLPGTPWDIEVRGAHAYVASGESGLQVIDLSRPGQPRLVGSADTAGDARRVAVRGARAYVADWEITEWDGRGGLRVIEISNPTRPAVVNSILRKVEDVSVSEGRIAIGGTLPFLDCIAIMGGSCDSGFLQAAHASAYEPGAPCALHTNRIAGSRSGASTALLPAAFGLTGNDPNPFNPQTSIHFDVPRASRVLIRIYDARGRLVKTLMDRVLQPGRHEVSWRGQGERGETVTSGVYFVRMDAEGFRQTRKITLLK